MFGLGAVTEVISSLVLMTAGHDLFGHSPRRVIVAHRHDVPSRKQPVEDAGAGSG
jgi:hypothetical protein